MGGPLTIRAGTEADARGVAEIHVRAWQWAYRGQLPNELLDRMSPDGPERHWRRFLGEEQGEGRLWVAERDGRMIGFASTSPSRDGDTGAETAELLTLYLEPDVVGTGVGRELLRHAVEDLRGRGYREAILWVLESNDRAHRFYEIAGWRADGATKSDWAGDVELKEVRYRIDFG